MYIRFVIAQTNPDSHHREGLFQALWRVEDEYELTPEDQAQLEDLYRWFCQYLPRPHRLARSRHPNAHSCAICWFKPTAHDCIRRMHTMSAIYRRLGLPTALITTRRPGYILYEDPYQIAAQPFRDTPT